MYHRERLPDELNLKVGARVVLLKNIDTEHGWVNGSLCDIIAITGNVIIVQNIVTKKTLPVCKMKQTLSIRGGIYTVVRQQYPLMLGWALTTHKVQGLTLSSAAIDLNESFFASGQAYVALSRVKSLEDLHLLSFDPKAIFFAPEIRDVLEDIHARDVIRGKDDIQSFPQHTPISDKGKSNILKATTTAKRKLYNTPAKKPPSTEIHAPPLKKARHDDISLSTEPRIQVPTMDPHRVLTLQEPSKSTNNQALLSNGRSRHSVGGQGDCFYRCISFCLYGTEIHHMTIHSEICHFLQRYADHFFQYSDSNTEEEFNRYIINQQNQGVWATQVEIFACATWLQVPLYIYISQPERDYYAWLLHKPKFPLDHNPFLCNYYLTLVNDSNTHYDVILPVEQKCNCQLPPPQLEGNSQGSIIDIT